MDSVTNHPLHPVTAFSLSTRRGGLPESPLTGIPSASGPEFTMNELARRDVRPNRVDWIFAFGCSTLRRAATQLPLVAGSGHLPEGTLTPKARLLRDALIPAKLKRESGCF